VTVGKGPIRSSADAAFFLAWIDRLEAAARANAAWNTESERAAVLGSLTDARAVYRDRSVVTRPR
jgi:hypothetical protein